MKHWKKQKEHTDASLKLLNTLILVMNKEKFTRIIIYAIIVVAAGSVAAFFQCEGLKGTFIAMAGGVLIVNLLISLYLARKNMK